MRIEPEIDGVSIVVLGSFNPAIFTPSWFAMYNLLPESTAASAELGIAHPELTQFRADWLNIQVTTDKFNAETLLAPHVRVRDLVVRVFKEHLYHTPLMALGINRNVHFRVRDFSARDRIGRTLAPVEPWGTWGQRLGTSGNQGGMASLTMRQVAVEGRPAGDQINVTVGPSIHIVEGALGVYVGVNDHYTAGETEERQSGRRLMEILEQNFDGSLKYGENIIDHVMSLAEG
jgi:hypothetical protein